MTPSQYLTDLVKKAALALDKARMIRYNPQTELLAATDLGRTASHFYIKHPTIEHFNSTFKPNLLEEEILGCISQADEFSQLKVNLAPLRKILKFYYIHQLQLITQTSLCSRNPQIF
jgi:activating signal cointegrator complex subunit 3